MRIDHDPDGEGLWPEADFTGRWEVHWPNLKLKFRADYKDGKEHGICECYWENGERCQIGEKHDGVSAGQWVDYWQNGVKKKIGQYGPSGRAGKWCTFYDDGTIMTEEEFVDGCLEGACRHFNGEGSITCDGIYRGGKPYSGICQTTIGWTPLILLTAEYREGTKVRDIERRPL